jgi:hypothetical protein
MISLEEMRAWLNHKIKWDEEDPYGTGGEDSRVMRAILSELEEKAKLKIDTSWMKLAEELGVPFSAVKVIRDKVEAELDGPSISKMPDGWWLHLTGNDGKMADIFLGLTHGPIVEKVLEDNASKGNVPIFNEEGNSNE